MNTYNFNIHKKMIVLFGLIFEGMKIQKFEEENLRDTSDDTKLLRKVQEIVVPVSYGNKDKFIARYLRRERSLKGAAMTLPRIAFQFSNIYRDESRQLNKLHQIVSSTANNAILNSQYAPVPFNFSIQMSVIASKQDDATKIVEQILPKFTPDLKISTNLIPENDIMVDISVSFEGVQPNDTYDKDPFATQRIITWDFDFVIKGYLFGPVKTQKLIDHTILNIDLNLDTANTGESILITSNSNYGFI